VTNEPNEPLINASRPERPSRGMAYLWIGIAAGFAFLAALYVGFVH
jgi:hypothetical protein